MTAATCPAHRSAPMRPGAPWQPLFGGAPIPTLKCTACAYHCRDQAPVKHPSSNEAGGPEGDAT